MPYNSCYNAGAQALGPECLQDMCLSAMGGTIQANMHLAIP
jgi:hypothetical protein